MKHLICARINKKDRPLLDEQGLERWVEKELFQGESSHRRRD